MVQRPVPPTGERRRMNINVQIGDDITVAGKVISVRENHFIGTTEILVQTNREHIHWFDVAEVKTHRPNGKGEKE